MNPGNVYTAKAGFACTQKPWSKTTIASSGISPPEQTCDAAFQLVG
jgi:hypothetical protein